jgi:LL-diaminopimelate aminotransferase
MTNIKPAERMVHLPPYLFARIEAKLNECRARGVDIINFGIGDPDSETPDYIIHRMERSIWLPRNHHYPSSAGLLNYRSAVSEWYLQRFGVEIDPVREVVTLIGSKEGVANISYCYLNPGDISIVPSPGYPIHKTGTLLAGGQVYEIPIGPETNFLVDFDCIPADIAAKAKILWLSYPNNPTGAVADFSFFEKAVKFAKANDILICHDNPYSEICFDGLKPPSILEVPGAKDVCIEFGSLSKPFNMTGWRIGWAVGNAEVISTLTTYKTNVDSGQFQAIQEAAITALKSDQEDVLELISMYQERRDKLIDGLNSIGWKPSILK